MTATRVAIALVRRGDQFLIGRRTGNVPLAGSWEFPGGKCLPDEPPHVAAARECFEETGLRVEPISTLEVLRHDYPHGSLELHFVLCRAVDDSSPRDDYCFVAREELSQYDFPPANATVLARLAAREDSQLG